MFWKTILEKSKKHKWIDKGEIMRVKDLTIGSLEDFTRSLCAGEMTDINCKKVNGEVMALCVTRNEKNIAMPTQTVSVDNVTFFIDDLSSPVGITVKNTYKVSRDITEAWKVSNYEALVEDTKKFMDIQSKYDATKNNDITNKFMVFASQKMIDEMDR